MRERGRRPNFVNFVVWSSLIVGVWVVVACSKKSCLGPAEIASFVFLVLFKDGKRRVSPRFPLFVSDVNQGNHEAHGFELATRGFELVTRGFKLVTRGFELVKLNS